MTLRKYCYLLFLYIFCILQTISSTYQIDLLYNLFDRKAVIHLIKSKLCTHLLLIHFILSNLILS